MQYVTKHHIFFLSDSWMGHPDILFSEKFFVCFRQSDKHLTHGPTEIRILSGDDFDNLSYYDSVHSSKVLNCPRLSLIDKEIILVVDEIDVDDSGLICCENQSSKTKVLLRRLNDTVWHDPKIDGIVPSKIVFFNGYYYLATHTKAPKTNPNTGAVVLDQFSSLYQKEQSNGILYQKIWRTKDIFSDWQHMCNISSPEFNLCEASLFVLDNRLVCMMRENSDLGNPALYIWLDGVNWSDLYRSRLFGCHRPVANVLASGNVLVTYREQSHTMSKRAWARNTFAALLFPKWVNGYLVLDEGIILPIDHNSCEKPDSGYTGWVEKNGNIFAVNYTNTPGYSNPGICGYSFSEYDFLDIADIE